ncbi:unnamed protein product [Peronospora farinosa]|uniref:Uncharacterized protein n=1 Tax=Peronospora farinosa TaxID=134698 RepID=A0AAV0TFW1_9STRA|nr:unnamed protein product [Peronospora farinosa]CAI5720892.1 unnamed protein product [Peronospora farinosa]
MSLAREVGRHTSKSKKDLLDWIENAIGSLETGEKYTKDEILEIAMVSAALSEYSEALLAKMYDRGEFNALPNVPLHTRNLRMPGKQQACRDSSDAANKDKLEAAHYIGLEVMLRLNERLSVEHRMGEELREILNHPSNLRLVLATSNQILHKKVDAMLINAIEIPASLKGTVVDSKCQRKTSAIEYDRLVQIAKHAQEKNFQDAMIAANGHYLYASLRQQFHLVNVGDRPKLWDTEKDKLELKHLPRSRFRSPSPAPRQPRTPPSPAKKRDPEPRMVNHSSVTASTFSEKKHRNPFSRLAAKIFHSRSTKTLAHATRSTLTSRQIPQEPPRSLVPKVQVKGKKKKSVAKTKTSHQTGSAKPKTKLDRKKKNHPRTVATKTIRKSAPLSSEESASFVNSSSEDSDYVDEDDEEDVEDVDRGVDEVGKDADRVFHIGPRGGKYYINATGKKVYAKAA